MLNDNPPKQIQKLTLLLLLLTSWTETIGDQELRPAWNGYDFDVLDRLAEERLISGSRKAKSIYVTGAGSSAAEKLAKTYWRTRQPKR